MRALNRKLLRDLRGMAAQLIAIALVIVIGVATYVSMRGVKDALELTRTEYYRDYRFADGFAAVRRAPEYMRSRLLKVPGIAELETRVTAPVHLEVADFADPIAGRIVSLPESGEPLLNRLYLQVGRMPRATADNEVVLNEVFARAHRLRPADTLSAIINGRRRTLRVVGVGLSPEYLLQVQPGSLFPDPEHYGVLWMGRTALSAAYDMDAAFNDVAFTLTSGADTTDVIERVDALLTPYGGPGAIARRDQQSHYMISEEFRQLRGTSTLLPAIFISVAAFLLNIVVGRLVDLQREQIGVLKAFGYRNRDVGGHYLLLVLLVAGAAAVCGTALGLWLMHVWGRLYLEYYRFPQINYSNAYGSVLQAVLITCAAAALGALRAVGRAARLAPAIAMRAAAPTTYRRSLAERIGLARALDPPTRMVVRHLERHPLRAALSVAGIAAACAILIMGLFFTDSFNFVLRTQYGSAQRQDLAVNFTEPTSTRAIYELAALPGVQHVEPFRVVPVRLRAGHRRYTTAIEGLPRNPYLRRIIDADNRILEVPSQGVVLTERLARILGVRAGDRITVEVREGRRVTTSVPVASLTRQFIGIAAYMDMQALMQLTRDGPAISGAFIMSDTREETALNRALRGRGRVTSILSHQRAVAVLTESFNRSIHTVTLILSMAAGVIAFGVVYNSARISLSERDRELASLRVLGLTRGEVGYIMLAELVLITLAAVPLGLVVGAYASSIISRALQTDLYQLPVIIARGTYGLAAVVVLAAATASGLIVRRRIRRLDLIAVLKTRE